MKKNISLKKIALEAHHATVRELTTTEKKKIFLRKIRTRIIRRKQFSWSNPHYSTTMSLAHLLYPKNFPKQVAVELSGQKHRFDTTYTKRASITNESQEGIESFYKYQSSAGGKKYSEHAKMISEKARAFGEKVFNESGLEINVLPMNTGITRKGDLIFFEVLNVKTPRLRSYIQKMPQKTPAQKLRKTQALELFKTIETFSPGETWVRVH